MLHTVNKSPYSHNCLAECLRVCGDNAAILLIEDGVYAALTDGPWLQSLQLSGAALYALDADVRARGLAGRVAAAVKCVDYTEFVQLCCEHATQQAWY
jgi:tRNA 2-thiouridine synthesizing protein B